MIYVVPIFLEIDASSPEAAQAAGKRCFDAIDLWLEAFDADDDPEGYPELLSVYPAQLHHVTLESEQL